MSKVLKVVAIVAIAVAVIVFAPQIAPLLAHVAGAVGISVTAAAISSALIMTALTVALTATFSLFRKTPTMSNSLADRLNTSVIPTAPRKVVFGKTAAGTDIRFFEVTGNKKDGYCQAVALASHRVNAILSWTLEDVLTWNGGLVAHTDGVLNFRAVTEGNSGNGQALGSGAYWTSSATFTGCAYAAISYKLSTDAWPQGIPQRQTFIVEGCPLYDPRRDSTAGGSGAHRANNQNTWQYRDGSVELGRNPALCLLTYLIGYRINGKLAWGMGVPTSRIDLDNFRLFANICEEQVALQAGGTTQRYTCDGIFSTSDTHETVISAITAAMGSTKMVDKGGLYCCVGGYDDTMGPTVDFTADDLIAPPGGAAPYVWSPSAPARDTFNIVRGRFADPSNLYQLADWGDPIEITPLADGVPRTMSLDLGCVSRAETCQRIAKQFLLRESLCQGTFTATFGPKAFAAEIGSLVTLQLPREGWNRKLFRVTDQTETHDLIFQMTLREEDAGVYAWDKEEKPLPASIRPPGFNPADTIAPTGVSATSATYEVV